MYIDDQTYKRGDKIYRRVLMRESYWHEGKVKNRTIANISKCSDAEIETIKLALKMKDNPAALSALANASFENGKSVGAVAALYQLSQKLGLTKALGNSDSAKRVLWLVIARFLGARSRLAAVRHANIYAACEIIGLEPFNEDDLYKDLIWLNENQSKIETRLFCKKNRNAKGVTAENIYLYDLTSSYLEGVENELAAFGYNRDGKRGKMQITHGLLCDASGDPISVEAFPGNTKDNATLENQLVKLKQRFGCKRVVIVGDKGMIKSGQIEDIAELGFNYITSITKPQIESLIKRGIIQYELFETKLMEAEDKENSVRYIFRRNPERAKEIKENRDDKIKRVEGKIEELNRYLAEHPKAKVETHEKAARELIGRMKMLKYSEIKAYAKEREIELKIDKAALNAEAKLDGCYCIKTDVSIEYAKSAELHDRYKDLALVEWAFRTEKSKLDIRPIYLRNEERTRAHLFVAMLSYKLELALRTTWKNINMEVSEGIKLLNLITAYKIKIGKETINKIPEPNKQCKNLLEPIGAVIPKALPYKETNLHTRKKLPSRRKTQ